MVNSSFFDSNIFFVDQKMNFSEFANRYEIYDEKGSRTGYIKQRLTLRQRIAGTFLKKGVLPFLLEIKDNHHRTLSSISRGWTFFLSTVNISDEQGELIATIKQKFNLFKPTFILFYASGKPLAEIKGDWKAWNFSIINEREMEIGGINKKLAGTFKERFTENDKYRVELQQMQQQKKESKIAILSAALCVDMIPEGE